ncbi:hypothetical protein [Phyllobacterium sp. SB3]|uniref:hypothetical protein n=1 Tax=Phyllobacterium sp. SB3 TaxID=3156073 RepID=UPI0032AF7E38
MIVTVWNVAMAGGGILGGLLLENAGVSAFPWTVVPLLAFTAVIAFSARRHGFPASRRL